jgi:hypothetical protein
MRKKPIQRFLDKIYITDSCWIWTGWKTDSGYGRFHYEGKDWVASKWIYEFYNGPVSIDKEIDHICEISSCVNPDHLRELDHRQNTLRSKYNITAICARKVYCKKGHKLPNMNKHRHRICRICANGRNRKYKQKLLCKKHKPQGDN